jgi:hypothetical protein
VISTSTENRPVSVYYRAEPVSRCHMCPDLNTVKNLSNQLPQMAFQWWHVNHVEKLTISSSIHQRRDTESAQVGHSTARRDDWRLLVEYTNRKQWPKRSGISNKSARKCRRCTPCVWTFLKISDVLPLVA